MSEIIIGDCLDVMRSMPDCSVDCVVTSPPYWAVRDYFGEPRVWHGMDWSQHRSMVVEDALCEDGCQWEDCIVPARGGVGRSANVGANKSGPDNNRGHPTVTQYCSKCGAWRGQLGQEPQVSEYVYHLALVFQEVWRVLRDRGVCWVNIADTWSVDLRCGVHRKCRCQVPERLALLMTDYGWILRSDCIWEAPNKAPEAVTDRFCKSYEHCYMFTKSPSYYFNQLQDGNHRMRDVWRIPTEPSKYEHSAMFPTELVRRMVESSCPKGGTVLDPFCGSGTTMEWCRENGYECIGIEINPQYEDIIRKRAKPDQRRMEEWRGARTRWT